jgi:hypothetical protein
MSNKFLSLDWFKQTAENAIAKVVANKLESLMEQEQTGSDYDLDKKVFEKPYINIKLVNDTLTVVLINGDIINKPGATEDDYHAVLNARSIHEIHTILASHEVVADVEKVRAEEARIKALQQGIQELVDLPDFTVEGSTVYLTGTSRSLPQILVEEFIRVVDRAANEPSKLSVNVSFHEYLNQDDEYVALKNFFMWCCLNPRAEVAHELYRFLSENSFRITRQGFVVALRNVVTLHGSPELVHFISNTYNKVKAVWKKNPSEYTVFLEDGEYKLVHDDKLFKEETFTSTTCPECEGEGQFYDEWDDEWTEECENCNGTGEVEEYEYTITVPVNHGEKIGNLVDLYLDLPNREENRFTDDWTKTFDIRIGQVTSMPMEECNWSTQDCAAAGLHFTADQIHYVGCGDQSVIVLINPMKVVGIGTHKGRCYEYLPIMTVPREEATRILHDGMFDTLQLDEEYAIRELESLAEKAKEGFATESKKYEFNMPAISAVEIGNIVANLNQMKAAISKRVSTIK